MTQPLDNRKLYESVAWQAEAEDWEPTTSTTLEFPFAVGGVRAPPEVAKLVWGEEMTENPKYTVETAVYASGDDNPHITLGVFSQYDNAKRFAYFVKAYGTMRAYMPGVALELKDKNGDWLMPDVLLDRQVLTRHETMKMVVDQAEYYLPQEQHPFHSESYAVKALPAVHYWNQRLPHVSLRKFVTEKADLLAESFLVNFADPCIYDMATKKFAEDVGELPSNPSLVRNIAMAPCSGKSHYARQFADLGVIDCDELPDLKALLAIPNCPNRDLYYRIRLLRYMFEEPERGSLWLHPCHRLLPTTLHLWLHDSDFWRNVYLRTGYPEMAKETGLTYYGSSQHNFVALTPEQAQYEKWHQEQRGDHSIDIGLQDLGRLCQYNNPSIKGWTYNQVTLLLGVANAEEL